MDSVAEIKMRLPIEQLVAQYCQLIKKGRSFVCLCPFHNDSHPSLLVSPDKGIAYCFACRSGGDIFSFYQKIEGCDFPQALRELAEKAGVRLEERASSAPKKDEKERARDCLQCALDLYREHLGSSSVAAEYLSRRGVPAEQIEQFQIGVSPDSFSATYEHLLKRGFSRMEILAAGLGIQKELREERIYDRFRNRLMFPIHDAQGGLVGFGGRTLSDEDAKYINSSEGILFHKSSVLYGMHRAKDAIREQGSAILVEGYFDVLACHRVGALNAVATCGTALTEAHAKLLKRYVQSVTLCLDQDRAGQDAMERAYLLLSAHDIHVDAVELPAKDPADAAQADPALLQALLQNASPYLDQVLGQLRGSDLQSPLPRRVALRRLLTLFGALSSSVERRDYAAKAAAVFGTTESALQEDLAAASAREIPAPAPSPTAPTPTRGESDLFSSVEIALGLIFFYPQLRHLLSELITPEEGMAAALYAALRAFSGDRIEVQSLPLPAEYRERLAVLELFCEHHAFHDWSETMAAREIRKHCKRANREVLRRKQEQITRRLVDATQAGKLTEQAQLQVQYQQVLRLMKMAS